MVTSLSYYRMLGLYRNRETKKVTGFFVSPGHLDLTYHNRTDEECCCSKSFSVQIGPIEFEVEWWKELENEHAHKAECLNVSAANGG